ncbi:MAG: anacyclamide/piricyclamide family prenylated cyclic peptide [Oscillatoria princeps RMCB-10]|jgi:prenylated cyclic peptide (anacyclamide/piricyclamide family)|nr:anacyclamide/piricyclamide family prenylated cyclic peptide [Oscillatoria princeps RMCB-10]
MKNRTVSPKQSAPVERNSHATAAGAGAEKGGVVPLFREYLGRGVPFAGDDAE